MKKVLHLISDTGGGHRVAARAVISALREMDPHLENELVDIFTLGHTFVNTLFGKAYGPMINTIPWLYKFLFYFMNNPTRFQWAFRLNYPFLGKQIIHYIEKVDPSVIVSLHPLANHLVVRALRDSGRFGKIPVITVVLDPITLHRSWVCPEVDLIIVATPEAKKLTISYGMPEEKIRVIGLPVDPRFSQEGLPREKIRAKLGLDQKMFTILLMGGGEGTGQILKFAQTLVYSGLPLQLVVVAGRNKNLEDALDQLTEESQSPMKVFGYTTEIPDLMAASDLLLTKAGPGTLAEALIKELPLIIISYVPGQEEGNIHWAELEGFGKLVEKPIQIADVVEKLMSGDQLERMRKIMKELKRPTAVYEICRLILDYVGST